MEGKAHTKRANGGQSKQPRPQFPEQHREHPGLESELTPKPRFEAGASTPTLRISPAPYCKSWAARRRADECAIVARRT